MPGIHLERPGAADLTAATGAPAISLGNDIWMSPGVSNSYALATGDGRVIINAGLIFEGPLHQKAYADVPGPTHTIVVTQGHPDHWGGIVFLREPGTDIVMQSNYPIWRDDFQRLVGFRTRNTSFAFAKFSTALTEHIKTMDLSQIDMAFPEPTTTFDDRLELKIGGRQLVLIATPGGETTDSLVVWLPEDRIVFTGNLFGPLFGHVPNLVTIRGDRYRDPLQYVSSLNIVLDLEPERLITGHFNPIEGTDRIAKEVTAMRDAVQWIHDCTIEGMESGNDVLTLMREIRLPGHLDVGEGYGKISWNVRAIWEMYAGWFHHRSTTELYGVPADSVAADVVGAAGADALLAAAGQHLSAGRPLQALHLAELILAADTQHPGARSVALDAHVLLLESSTNFWEKAWLNRNIDELSTSE